jgi:hypothetical protein
MAKSREDQFHSNPYEWHPEKVSTRGDDVSPRATKKHDAAMKRIDRLNDKELE